MIPKNIDDVLNIENTISENPDNTELEIWLSLMHIPIYISYRDLADAGNKLEIIQFELSKLRTNTFLSLNKKDYGTFKAMKTVVEGRSDVIALCKKERRAKYYLKACEIKLNRFIARNSIINAMTYNRANTSNYQENIDWDIKLKRRRN